MSTKSLWCDDIQKVDQPQTFRGKILLTHTSIYLSEKLAKPFRKRKTKKTKEVTESPEICPVIEFQYHMRLLTEPLLDS